MCLVCNNAVWLVFSDRKISNSRFNDGSELCSVATVYHQTYSNVTVCQCNDSGLNVTQCWSDC